MGYLQRQRERNPRLYRRSRRQARREVRPQQRASRQEIDRLQRLAMREQGRITRQGSRAQQGFQRAGSQAAQEYRQAAQSLPGNIATGGLVRRQLMQSAGDYARYGQGLGNLASRAARQDVRALNQGLRQDISSVRSQVPSVAQTTREILMEAVPARRQAQREAQVERGEEMGLARSEAKRIIDSTSIPNLRALTDPNVRVAFADQVSNMEGISDVAARRAVDDYYERVVRPYLRQNQPGPFGAITEGALALTGRDFRDELRR